MNGTQAQDPQTRRDTAAAADDDLIALLVPARHSRVQTAAVLVLVALLLAGIAATIRSAAIVPRARVDLDLADTAHNEITMTFRVTNNGWLPLQVRGINAPAFGLSEMQVVTPLPRTIPAGSSAAVTVVYHHVDRQMTGSDERSHVIELHVHNSLGLPLTRAYDVGGIATGSDSWSQETVTRFCEGN